MYDIFLEHYYVRKRPNRFLLGWNQSEILGISLFSVSLVNIPLICWYKNQLFASETKPETDAIRLCGIHG